MHGRSPTCWELLYPFAHHCQHARNNSQHCCANNVDCARLHAALNNENADVPDVMISNRKFDISLDGTLLSHTTNLNAFVLGPAVRICRVRALKERKYQLPVAIFDFRDVNVLVT